MSKDVLIQEELLNKLKVAVEQFGADSRPKIKLDGAVCFASLLNSIPTERRKEEDEEEDLDDSVNLNAEILKKHYHSSYKTYLEFLIKHSFIIQTGNYGADTGQSNSYKICDEYIDDNLVVYTITDKTMLKKINSLCEVERKKAECETLRPHLVKFFDDKLTIDTISAHRESKLLSRKSYNRYMHSILEFTTRSYKYGMNINTDNRLHTSITKPLKSLRRFVKYDGEHIIGCDLKSSQPYFLCAVSKAVYYKDKGLLEQITATDVIPDEVVNKLFNLDLDRDNLAYFIKSTLVDNPLGDLYDVFAHHLEIQYNSAGLPFRKISNFKSKSKGKRRVKREKKPYRIMVYKSERDLAKKVMMEIFYSKPKTKIPEAKVFKELFPAVHKIITCLYDNGVKFSRVLQYIEAYCLLDYTAKKIADRYPDMPLWSIHDALVTTEPYKEILKSKMEQYLKEITTLKTPPRFDFEDWEESVLHNKQSA